MHKPAYSATPSAAANPLGLHGMVTSPHYLASQAGIHALRQGGTAVDAAIAAAAVLCVTYPHMCGLGGDNFWLIYHADTGRLRALNGSGRAARAAAPDVYARLGLARIPQRGPLAAITVPGAVSGWAEAHKLSRQAMRSPLSWGDLLADARRYAHEGFAVGPSLARALALVTAPGGASLAQREDFCAVFGSAHGWPRTGHVLRQPRLAATLDRLAANGPDEFYQGETAHVLAKALAGQGGLLTAEDLKAHRADWAEPLEVSYRHCTAHTPPPNSQGISTLEILNILQQVDVSALTEGGADHIHLIAEATREAFLDRQHYLTDPEFFPVPASRLLSREHGRAQAARIRMDRAAAPLPPLPPGGDTVWLGAVDAAGNAVSLIQSIYHEFGSGVMAAGFALQNRGCAFALDASHVNCLRGGKRTLHTLTPAMLLQDGKPWLVCGSMGGDGQPQTIAALVTRMVDFGLEPQDAVTAPRWLLGRSWGDESNDLKLEGRIPLAVAEELRARGHAVRQVKDYAEMMGHAGALLRRKNGVWQGACDPRGDGLAAAL